MAPPVFREGQLYVIRAPLRDTYVTCVYALMTGKLQAEYEELLEAVLTALRCIGLAADLSVVMTDYEQAVMRALTDTLGHHVDNQGCFYHLTQNTW